MKTIMVVDDELPILNKVKSCLENDNFDVITAVNSREALEILDKYEEDLGLILIDTPMPGNRTSAFFSIKPKSKIDSSKLENFLQKPFTDKELLSFVRSKM